MQDSCSSRWGDPLDTQILGNNHSSFLANSYGGIVCVSADVPGGYAAVYGGLINISGRVKRNRNLSTCNLKTLHAVHIQAFVYYTSLVSRFHSTCPDLDDTRM